MMPASDATEAAMLPLLDVALGDASVRTEHGLLTVKAGCMHRVWRWTPRGPSTMAIFDQDRGFSVEATDHSDDTDQCDWQLPDAEPPHHDAQLVRLDAAVIREDPLTSDHLRMEMVVAHPSQGIEVKWTLWIYPGTAGIRSQHAARLTGPRPPATRSADRAEMSSAPDPATRPDAVSPQARVDHLPLVHPPGEIWPRLAAGYYVGTQDRNAPDTPLLRREASRTILRPGEVEDYPWANLITVEAPHAAITVVKESHKGVNETGYATGSFQVGQFSLNVTGWGLRPSDLVEASWHAGWATWTLLHAPGEFQRQRAIKQFDRQRYPIDPAQDLPTMVNLWGSSDSAEAARDLADEAVVLDAIDRAAQIGIELVQIDDGWQTPPGSTTFSEGDWRPHPERYPKGWTRVRQRAKARGVALGLWAAWTIPAERLEENRVAGDFKHFKIDFMVLDTYAKIQGLIQRVSAVVRHADSPTRINWDLTERSPRVGTYFAREFGSVYLANRKPTWPQRIVYAPCLMLRDAWHLAHYTNLQKFQISTTNLDRCDPTRSNAAQHSPDYALAITLMGSPLWFCHPRELSDAAVAAFQPLLETYKQHRQQMARCVVYPIGNEPDDRQWTGFQAHDPTDDSGYLLIFREMNCPHRNSVIALPITDTKPRRLHRLGGANSGQVNVQDDGKVAVTLDAPGQFLFLRYQNEPEAPRNRSVSVS